MSQRTGEVSVQVVRSGRQVRVVRRISLSSQRIVFSAHVRRCHPLLLLPTVAEPHPHHLLVQPQLLRQQGDLLGAGLGALEEVLLQRLLDGHLYAGSLLPLPALGCDLVYVG